VLRGGCGADTRLPHDLHGGEQQPIPDAAHAARGEEACAWQREAGQRATSAARPKPTMTASAAAELGAPPDCAPRAGSSLS
jgi:hypothetical protein